MILNTKDFGGFGNFNAILKRISKFAYPDEHRFNLNGIYIEFKTTQTILTATNGYSLISETFDMKNKKEGNFILKLQTVEILINKSNDYELKFVNDTNKPYVIVNNAKSPYAILDESVEKPTCNAPYPDYKQAIPGTTKELIRINKTKCLEDLRVVLGATNYLIEEEKNKEIKELIKSAQEEANRIEAILEDEVYTDDLDNIMDKLEKLGVKCSYNLPSLSVELDIDYSAKAEKLVFINDNGTYSLAQASNSISAFNLKYFYDFISEANSEEICIMSEGRNSAIKSQNGDQILLLMPRRINN